VNAADTSVLVAAFATWHDRHDEAAEALAGCRLIAHTAVELLSVLTRLPEPHRVEGRLVAEFLDDTFPSPPLVLSPEAARALPNDLVAAKVAGGAVYDGLVAITAQVNNATLISLDGRASTTYKRLGVEFTLIS
jgi:predicted nucleic acid-binding protein